MKENKKVVNTVSKFVSGSAKEYSVLKGKSEKMAKDLKKKWADSEPKRKEIEANTKKAVKNIVDKSVQFSKDVTKGVKKGLK